MNQKNACIRCRCVFASKGQEHCPRCEADLARRSFKADKIRKQTAPLENPVIECLIKRDGPTVFPIGGCHYTFRRNEAGHSVCTVTNPAHHRHLLKLQDFFRLYEPTAEV